MVPQLLRLREKLFQGKYHMVPVCLKANPSLFHELDETWSLGVLWKIVACDFGQFYCCYSLIPLVYQLQSHHRPAKCSCNESNQMTKNWMRRNISNLGYLTPHYCPPTDSRQLQLLYHLLMNKGNINHQRNCLRLFNAWVCPTWREVSKFK